MEEAQEALGFDPNEFIPITYTNELSWSQELLHLLPTLLLIGGYVWFTRRGMGGGGMGGGMGGGRGIFNVGKAQVGTIDKNAKDKIMFKVGQGLKTSILSQLCSLIAILICVCRRCGCLRPRLLIVEYLNSSVICFVSMFNVLGTNWGPTDRVWFMQNFQSKCCSYWQHSFK